MANIFEIVDKLNKKQEVVIANKYRGTVMQQLSDHFSHLTRVAVKFSPHCKGYFRLTSDEHIYIP